MPPDRHLQPEARPPPTSRRALTNPAVLHPTEISFNCRSPSSNSTSHFRPPPTEFALLMARPPLPIENGASCQTPPTQVVEWEGSGGWHPRPRPARRRAGHAKPAVNPIACGSNPVLNPASAGVLNPALAGGHPPGQGSLACHRITWSWSARTRRQFFEGLVRADQAAKIEVGLLVHVDQRGGVAPGPVQGASFVGQQRYTWKAEPLRERHSECASVSRSSCRLRSST
jgi:hypothetical protein